MTWRTLAEALESAIAKGFDGEQGVGAPQAVTEFMAEDRSGLDATPVTPPRTGTVPAHGNGKGRGMKKAPASETGQRRRKGEASGGAYSGQEESRALPIGRCEPTQVPSASPTRRVGSHLTIVEGSGRRAPEGVAELAGRTRNSGRERVREYLRLAWSA